MQGCRRGWVSCFLFHVLTFLNSVDEAGGKAEPEYGVAVFSNETTPAFMFLSLICIEIYSLKS